MKQKENKQEANERLAYVTPHVEVVSLDHCSPLLQFSGGHNDAGNDGNPLHARRNDFFDMEEDEEECSPERKLNW